MEIQDYININKNLYTTFSKYIDNHLDDNDEYQNLTSFLTTHDYLTNVEILPEFLRLISNVSKNHTRENNFLNKIYKILYFLKDTLNNIFPKLEIFNIFKDNKIVLLFLFTNIIETDATIIENLKQTYLFDDYFYKIAKPFLDSRKKQEIEKFLIKVGIFDDFDERCQKGENDSYLCYLIRNDKIEQFIQYINKNSIDLNSIIKTSIFETNPFLIKNKKTTTIIEYASFFGSIQIIQYLRSNSIQLTESAWIYAIHSNNAELFTIFQENCSVTVKKTFYKELFKEAIKCHHNEIAQYIFENYYNDENGMIDLYDYILCYHNFNFFPDDVKNASCSVNDIIMCMHYFQIKSVVIVVDQMESIKYSEEQFNEIKNEMTSILIKNGFDSKQFQFVPISENKNENIKDKSPNFSWWNGLTLDEIICLLKPPQRPYFKDIRVAVTFFKETYFDESDSYPDSRKIKGIVKSGVVSTPCYLNSAFSENIQADLNFNRKTYAYPGEIKFFDYFYYDPHKLDLLGPQRGNSSSPSKCITFTAILIIINLNEELKVRWTPNIQFIHGFLKCKLIKIGYGIESKSAKKYEHVKVTFAPCDLIALETFNDYPNIGVFSIDENNALQAIGFIFEIENK